jgi:hypothetical protein
MYIQNKKQVIFYKLKCTMQISIYIIYLTILKSFYYYWALVSNLNWNNGLFVTDCQKLWLSLIGYLPLCLDEEI